MQDWSADSFYKFGEVVLLKSSIYFCLALRTDSHPTEMSDWLRVDRTCEELPDSGYCGEVVFVELYEKCFIFVTEWKEIYFKKIEPICFSNRNPKKHDEGKIWINEVDGFVFKKGEAWSVINHGDEEIFEYPFKPTLLDDENDTAGNGVITEGSLWIDFKGNKVYQNVNPSHMNSIWKKI